MTIKASVKNRVTLLTRAATVTIFKISHVFIMGITLEKAQLMIYM